jgi:hypothetical protein
MNYAPGTILRLKGSDGSEHLAIQRSNGNVLELTGGGRKTFTTVKEWEAERGGTAIPDGERMMVVGTDTRGFQYDWEYRNYSRFTNWVFEMISEFAPALLDREDVRDAFNHLVATFEKPAVTINYTWHMKMGTRQYLFCGWRYSVDYMAAYGLPFHIEKGAGSTDVWKETHAAWTPLLKLIEPVRAALQKKRDLYYLERDIKWQTRRYYRAKYQADKYKRYFDVEKERLEKLESKKAALLV